MVTVLIDIANKTKLKVKIQIQKWKIITFYIDDRPCLLDSSFDRHAAPQHLASSHWPFKQGCLLSQALHHVFF